jgi:hypothetical protein
MSAETPPIDPPSPEGVSEKPVPAELSQEQLKEIEQRHIAEAEEWQAAKEAAEAVDAEKLEQVRKKLHMTADESSPEPTNSPESEEALISNEVEPNETLEPLPRNRSLVAYEPPVTRLDYEILPKPVIDLPPVITLRDESFQRALAVESNPSNPENNEEEPGNPEDQAERARNGENNALVRHVLRVTGEHLVHPEEDEEDPEEKKRKEKIREKLKSAAANGKIALGMAAAGVGVGWGALTLGSAVYASSPVFGYAAWLSGAGIFGAGVLGIAAAWFGVIAVQELYKAFKANGGFGGIFTGGKGGSGKPAAKKPGAKAAPAPAHH